MKKKMLLPIVLMGVAGGLLVGCSNETNTQSVENKTAYASASALSLVNKATSNTGVKKAKVETNVFDDIVSQFDVLLSAKESTNVKVISNSGGEYAFTNEITIGEDSKFTYLLNYNQTTEEGLVKEEGELVINYSPLQFNFSLNFENIITYDKNNKNGSIDFKLYIDVLNKESTTSYVRVSEIVDLVNPSFNSFDYSLVVNERELMSYRIEIPEVDGQALNLYIGSMKYSIRREVSESGSSIVIASYVNEIEVFSIVYNKEINDGNVSYNLQINRGE